MIEQRTGTAPGLICPVGDRVVYAVPGVPYEMKEMLERAVLPDLAARAGVRQVIASRVLRTWGESESRVAELLDPRLAALDETGTATIAFLASGIEGIKVRLTARGDSEEHVDGAARRRGGRGARRARRHRLQRRRPPDGGRGRSAARGAGAARSPSPSRSPAAWRRRGSSNVPGSSEWFKGGVVAYDSQVKFDVLDVPEGPVVSEAAAKAMADGVRRAARAPTSASPPPAWPAPPSRRASRRAPCGSGVAVGDDVEAAAAPPPRRPRPRPPAQRDQPHGPAPPQAASPDHSSIE